MYGVDGFLSLEVIVLVYLDDGGWQCDGGSLRSLGRASNYLGLGCVFQFELDLLCIGTLCFSV